MSLPDIPLVVPDGYILSDEQQQLISDCGFTVIADASELSSYLYFDQDKLSYCQDKSSITVDFCAGKARHRREFGGGELITRAANSKQYHTVWDFTAGLGRDAFVLASAGMRVALFERHPVVYALLRDGLQRASCDPDIAETVARMSLFGSDVLQNQEQLDTLSRPQIIYLDPMYPPAQKSAAVKKEMACFHTLVGPQEHESEDLLSLALSFASKRVVVKRPRLAQTLTSRKPDYNYSGKSTRFDVYVPDHPKKDD